MTDNQAINQQQVQENKPSDKELNFRAIEARLRKETEARLEAEKKTEEALKMAQEAQNRRSDEEDDSDDDPYVGHKKLEKKFSSFEKKMEERIERKAEERARVLIDNEKNESWLRNNPDYYDVMQHAEKFAQKDPELAETILRMHEGFDRNKIVYKNIKALGLHKPESKEPSVQDKIDANRRSPYYQPSGIGTAPYQSAGDFSPAGQKNAHAKMKELQARLRM